MIDVKEACKIDDDSEILRLAQLSHDGDRIYKSSRINDKWVTGKYDASMTDSRLDDISRSFKENPDKPETHIRRLSGRFRRSIPQMDILADIVDAFLPGDAAIRVMGAGMGGEMHAFVRKNRLNDFLNIVHEEYFHKIMKIDQPRMTILQGSNVGASVLAAT